MNAPANALANAPAHAIGATSVDAKRREEKGTQDKGSQETGRQENSRSAASTTSSRNVTREPRDGVVTK